MKRALILAPVALLLAGGQAAAEVEGDAGANAPAVPAKPLLPAARLPGFAAMLAQQPAIRGGDAWPIIAQDAAWRALAAARAPDRQQVRWNYARSLIGQERGGEALGVLDVMQQDDPDLVMVDAYRLARGAALVQLARSTDASIELAAGGLADNPEACAWRMRALAQSGFAEQAVQQLACAAEALARPRNPAFARAAARAGVEAGQPENALKWAKNLPDRDPAANLYRGRAALALGRPDEARLRFARVEQSGGMALRMDARLSSIEAEVANGALKPAAALKRIAALRFAWRGDAIEERALRLSYRLSVERDDLPDALASGAALFRYFGAERQGGTFLPDLQAMLAAALDPARKLPLEQAAGLYWDYRDLSPSGAEGDLLVSRLAERLQGAGLYARAADLLEHQLFHRAGSLARGPLSARVAGLQILAGRPAHAIDVLKRSVDPAFPDAMIHERKRVEAVALAQNGRVTEAFAVLQDVPGSGFLRAEILWKRRDWSGFAAETARALPTRQPLSAIDQTVLLRQAISLAMLGREDELARLRARYGAAFQGVATAPVFDMLTGTAGGKAPATLARAMAAMPGGSPAGDIAVLIERAPIPAAAKQGG